MRKIYTGFTALFLLLLTLSCFAVTLYEQPDEKSKVVVTLTKDVMLIPIFDPHKGDWIKVADPSNGNVGWVKSHELKNLNTWPRNTTISVQEQTVTSDGKDGNQPQTYRVIVLGGAGANSLKPEEAQALVKQMQVRQQQWQQHFNRMMERLYYHAREFDDMFNFSLFPRVIIVPQSETKPAAVGHPNTTGTPVSTTPGVQPTQPGVQPQTQPQPQLQPNMQPNKPTVAPPPAPVVKP